MRIDSSGNLLVGTTQTPSEIITGSTYEGLAYQSGDYFVVARSSAPPISANRLTSDGDIMQFRKDGSTVGSIGTFNGDGYIGNGDVGFIFADGDDSILPANTSTPAYRTDAVSLGNSSYRFKDLYLSGGVYLGGTGSANKLDDYEEGTWTPAMSGYSGVTYGTRVGYYTKVGRMVMANFYMSITNIGTYTGNSHIAGLPFAAGISNTAACGVQLTVMTALNATRDEHFGALYNGGSSLFIYDKSGNARNGNNHQAGAYAGTLVYMTS
jgi:hypothetical protein